MPSAASPRPFLILALPRSRTAWLANFLTHGRVRCAHDLSHLAPTPAEVPQFLRALAAAAPGEIRFSGNADTSQALILPQLRLAMPEAPLVVIRRRPAEVVDSFARLGHRWGGRIVRHLLPYVEAAARTPGALVLDYEDLHEESAVRAVQAHVAPGEPFDAGRWVMLRDLNVQITAARMDEMMTEAGEAGHDALRRMLTSN
jgi:hypothetical protein